MSTYPSTPRQLTRLLIFILAGAAASVAALAQGHKGTLTGVVRDPNGAAVRGAAVKATNAATGTAREAATDGEGGYTIPALEPGVYRVTVEAQGFRATTVEGVRVETNARRTVDAALAVGGAGGESVTVNASAALAEAGTSVRGDLITGREVTDLPLAQRNFMLLAGLSPGVTRPSAAGLLSGSSFEAGGPGLPTEGTRFRESGGSVISANGARVTVNSFMLDGVDNNEPQFGQIALFPALDAIAEFKVETSVPPAEVGRAGGAVLSATYKSGGNALHGSLFEFYQGRFAGAKPVYDANPPNFNTHNFGGTLGGPVFLPRFGEGGPRLYDGRGKSFFFASYAGQRNVSPSFLSGVPVTVPTLKMRQGDFSEFLRPGTPHTYNTVRGPVVAPLGTVFDRNGNPFPGNVVPSSLFSPAASRILNAYPLPTGTGLVDNYTPRTRERHDIDQLDIRLDHNFTGANRLFGRYSRMLHERGRDNLFPRGSSPNGFDLPAGFGTGEERGHARQFALGDTHVFSPRLVNDARAGYSRVEIGVFASGGDGALGFDPNLAANIGIPGYNVCGTPCEGLPVILLTGLFEPIDVEAVGGTNFFYVSNSFYFGDTLTVVRGGHTLKFGGELRVRQSQPADAVTNSVIIYGTQVGGFVSGSYGGIPVGPRDAGLSSANFLLGNSPAFVSRNAPTGLYLLSGKEVSFFAQDDWKVSPSLTLNLGLRYDLFTPPTERHDRQLNFVPARNALVRAGGGVPRGLRETDRNNFGPRVGFAWSGLRRDQSVVLRGGYGLLYSIDPGEVGTLATRQPFNGADNSYFCSIGDFGTSRCPQFAPNFRLDDGLPFPAETYRAGPVFAASSLPPFSTVTGIDLDLKDAMYHQLNLTGQWEFRRDWLAEAAYVGNFGRHLRIERNIGAGISSAPGSRQVTGLDVVNFTDDTGESSYHALQTKLRKRLERGLSVLAAYTWSHAIDNGPGIYGGYSVPDNLSRGFNHPTDLNLERGNSDFDLRHRFTLASVYDLPFGRGRRFGTDWPRALDFLLGGLQWNNIVTVQSGPTYSVLYGFNGQRPTLVGDPRPTADQRARRMRFNPAAFAPPSLPAFPGTVCTAAAGPSFDGCYGTLGRNTFRGDRQEFWDASLFKNFRWGERVNLQARLQVYNVLNHVVRSVPERNVSPCFTGGVFNAAECAQFTTDDPARLHIGIDTSAQRQRRIEWGLRLVF